MLETKLLSGNSGYGVVGPSAAFLQRQVADGVCQPIDRARLSNGGKLDLGMMALLATRPYVGYINTVPLLEDLAASNLCAAVLWRGDA